MMDSNLTVKLSYHGLAAQSIFVETVEEGTAMLKQLAFAINEGKKVHMVNDSSVVSLENIRDIQITTLVLEKPSYLQTKV